MCLWALFFRFREFWPLWIMDALSHALKRKSFQYDTFFWLGRGFIYLFMLLLIGIISEVPISSAPRELINCNVLAVGLMDVGDQVTDSLLPFLLQLKSRCFLNKYCSCKSPNLEWWKKEKKWKAKPGWVLMSQTMCHVYLFFLCDGRQICDCKANIVSTC